MKARLQKHLQNMADLCIISQTTFPDKNPNRFSVFLCRIVRNLALKKYEYIFAAKRNPAAVTSLEELGDCVSGTDSIELEIEKKHIETICKYTGFSQSKVKSMLYEMRRKLKKYLESEGIKA